MTASFRAARVLLLSSLFAVAGRSVAQTATPAKPDLTPVLVELYTSEGCNSCPPADELLRKLDGMATVTGQTILALSEHVTYWNQLGWTDPFSNEVFSERQNTYGENFNMEEIYTPMVVVNGAQAVLGSDRAAVLAAVSFQALPSPVSVEVLSARASGGNLFVAYMLSGKVPAAGGEVYAALVDDLDTMQVAHGENAGRTLSHVSVVRSFGKGAMLKAGEQSILTLALPAAPAISNAPGQHLVVFVQVAGQGRVIAMVRQPVSVTFPTTDTGPVAVRRRTLGAR